MNKQFYGIKYPFNEESDRRTFFDLNENEEDGVRSMLLHIILTPKGQRIRQPNFGTNIIKFIFEPNDDTTWEGIKNEITEQVKKYLPQVTFNDVKVITNEDNDNEIFLSIDYSVTKNGKTANNKTIVKL